MTAGEEDDASHAIERAPLMWYEILVLVGSRHVAFDM